jgi:hypothetical protein
MRSPNLPIFGIDNTPAGKMNYTIHALQDELQRAIFYDDHDGRGLAREVLRAAFDVLDGSGRAAGLHLDAISDLQPRLEGALTLVRALRKVLCTDGDVSSTSVRVV